MGQLVAEYSDTQQSSGAGTSYLTSDTLGSPRVITDANGNVTSRHDYLPFGEEVSLGRNSSYAGDNVRQKFTSYERDDETGLDFAQARYYSGTQGRFTSVDPLMASASVLSPQSWNRYAYTANPLRFTDPSGMAPGDFYNLDGKRIGTDGNPDEKIIIVYDKDKAKEIEKTKGNYSGSVDSSITLPNADVVTAIGDAVIRSNNASFTGNLARDEKASGGFAEAGVTWKTIDGKTEITAAPNGATADPRPEKAYAEIFLPSNVDGKAHIHPSGEIVSGGDRSGGGVMVMGGTTTTSYFEQAPSNIRRDGKPGDIPNAIPNGTNIVVGARNKTVYFYNTSGTFAKMSLGNFSKIGRQR